MYIVELETQLAQVGDALLGYEIIVKYLLEDDVMDAYLAALVALDDTEHGGEVHHGVVHVVGHRVAKNGDGVDETLQFGIFLKAFGEAREQRVFFQNGLFCGLLHALHRPVLFQLLVDDLAQFAHEERIAEGVLVNLFAHGLDVHARVYVVLIVGEHLCYLFRVEGHVHLEVGGNVPLHVVDTCEDNAVESVVHAFSVPLQVPIAQHSEEVEKQLVIAALIHLVDSYHDRFWGFLAELCYH